ncbi:amino acid transporter [Ceraceosorus bombacis]|uniref:Amino acid transporter n=1 Tax=Ceraceosorus bombacis TaxID=401625 RepID=A0A0P1BL63_9BASI|nr:amino acid transporter [Ceraceosorus bombacis]
MDMSKDDVEKQHGGAMVQESVEPYEGPTSVDAIASTSSSGVVEARTAAAAATAAASREKGTILSESKNLGRYHTALILFTNQVGLGILSLPRACQILGIVPGVIAIIGIGLLSTYTAYVLLQYWRRYPHALNMVDFARILGGRALEMVVGISFVLNLVLTCASSSVTISTALNSISENALCTAGFVGFAALASFILSLPRTFKFVAHVGVPSTISIIAAVLIVMISLGVADEAQLGRGAAAAQSESEAVRIEVIGRPNFSQGLSACLNIAYAYAGNSGFVSVMAEMRDASHDFVPALVWLQAAAITLYVVTAIVVYALAGQYTTSPALGAAPATIAKIAYGIALPCLLGTALVFGHTAIKYLYIISLKLLGAQNQATSNTKTSWISWISCALLFWTAAFLIANAVPIFDSILDISSATFIAWFTFGISGVFWFHLNWHPDDQTGVRPFKKNWKKKTLALLNVAIIVIALFMNSAGLYVAITRLLHIFRDDANAISAPFTCADNSVF